MSRYQVHLLGGLALKEPSGGVIHSLSQRRAEATLAILAVCGELGCSRERLIGLLWPERDEATARHSLRDALYAIRGALDREAVPGTGEVLHLDPAVVESDVQRFEEALEAGRLADAVGLYRGPFLDGFHLDDALEFERWLEEERARLLRERQQAVRALARAEEAEGRWDVAAEWWARAVVADPYDSRLMARRMEALACAGDRANAVLEGEAHARRLRSELELEPDPAFVQALERIRSGELPLPRASEPPRERASSVDHTAAPGTGTAASESASPPGPAIDERSRWDRALVAAVAMVSVTALVVLVTMMARSAGPAGPRLTEPIRITTAVGVETSPSWAPDGGALAFESTRDGDTDIWVVQLGTGEPVNRTADNPTKDLRPRWSPDGRWISFFSEREGGGYFIMPAMGGTPRKVAGWPSRETSPSPAEWSPDGLELAFARGQRDTPWIRIVVPDGDDARRLPLPARPRSNVVVGMRWSPDRRFLAYSRAISPIAATAELWLTDVTSGESVQLTDGSYRDISPAWAPDSETLFFSSDRAGSPDLWRLPISETGRPQGPPQQVTEGMELRDIALSPDGNRIAYTRGRRVHNVYRAPIPHGRLVTWSDVTQLTFDEADFETIDVDGNGRLLLSSDRSGNWDIFLRPSDGGRLRRLTRDPTLDAGPGWRPDGRGLVFYSSRTGHRQLWTLSLDGGPPRQLTRGPTEKLYPDWSRDGTEIVAGGPGLIVVSVETGETRRLAEASAAAHPDWSPDGRWIVFTAAGDDPLSLWRVAAAGGEPEQITDHQGRVPRWSPDGETVYFLGQGEHADTIWALSPDSGDVRPVTGFAGRPGHLARLGLAVDDRYLYFTWRESQGDLWVAEVDVTTE